MEPYTTECQQQKVIENREQIAKQNVIEQLNQLVLALAELRASLGAEPEINVIFELLQGGTDELKMTIAREWVIA